MKLNYHPDTDTLYIELRPEPGADADEIADGIVIDYGADGRPVGIEIDRASHHVDLTSLQASELPAVTAPASAVPFACLNGIDVHYETFGPDDGPAVLLAAPGGFDSTIEKWRTTGAWPEVNPLGSLPAAGYRVIAYDRRESGESGGRFEPLSWDLYATEIEELRRHLEIDSFFLLGGCMGCSTAFSYAVRYPHSVRGLLLHWPIGGQSFYEHARDVWMAGAISYPREAGMEAVVRLAQEAGSMMKDVRAGPWAPVIARDPALAETIRRVSVDEYVSVLEQTRDNLFPGDPEAPGATPGELAKLNVPVFIAPGDDPFHAASAADYLDARLPNSHKWVPRGEQTGESLREGLISFLKRHTS